MAEAVPAANTHSADQAAPTARDGCPLVVSVNPWGLTA